MSSNCFLNAQLRDNVWVFGDSVGIDFSDLNNPEVIPTGIQGSSENLSTISSDSGKLQFYLHGINFQTFSRAQIFNWRHILMSNGSNLYSGDSESQGSIILPWPRNEDKYILFHLSSELGPNLGLSYSIIDMQLNNGEGEVLSKNNRLIHVGMNEKLQSVKHANGEDWWLLAHLNASSKFIKYLVSKSGISDSSSQNIGPWISSGFCGEIGQMKFSQKGNRLAFVNLGGTIDLYKFNRCNGELYDWIAISPISGSCPSYYACSFSPNGNLLYVSTFDRIYQFNLLAPDIQGSSILLFQDTMDRILFLQSQLGPDNKIYLANPFELYPTSHLDSFNTHLTVIRYPDTLGLGCQVMPYCFSLNGRRNYGGLPNMPNYNLGPLPSYQADAGANITICQGDTATIGAQTVDSVLYQWTVAGGASHQISSLTTAQPLVWPDSTTTYYLLIDDTVGDYSCAVRDDTITVYVVGLQITGIPQISLIGDSLFASVDGDTAGLAYHWFFDDSLVFVSSLPVYVPGVEGEYFVEVVDSFGCSSGLSEGFVFLVDGIFNAIISECDNVIIFPNPARDEFRLTINDIRFTKFGEPLRLTLFDVFAKVLHQIYEGHEGVLWFCCRVLFRSVGAF